MSDWFVMNVADGYARVHPDFGSSVWFARPDDESFSQLGINIRVLEPGKPNCLYHHENLQEDFLVLHGEGLLLVDGEERPVKAWDFIHLPPGTDHVMVGAGEGPCVVLMVGARSSDEELLYPVSELAAKYNASAEKDTPNPEEAYARFPEGEFGKPPYWDELPWAN